MTEIRMARAEDFAQIWPILRNICRVGDTFAQPRDIDQDSGYNYWIASARQTYVYLRDGVVIGSYYLKTNQQGGGSHVCNAGYIVSEQARGLGVAADMCVHSQAVANDLGYKAMQFNFVVSSNTAAVHLWQKLSFEIVGRLPLAFLHPEIGYVDALVMSKKLTDSTGNTNC